MKNLISGNLVQTEVRILRSIYETAPISRVQLAKDLQLTKGTITTITKKLLDLNLINEVGKGVSSAKRGRRKIFLHVNPDAGYVISIHIALSYVSFGIVNLSGCIVDKKTIYFELGAAPENILPPLYQGIMDLIASNNILESRIIGVGLAIPGIMDYKTGSVLGQTLKNWIGFPIQEHVEKHLGFKVYIENDVKTITLGEYQFGTGNHVKNMVCFWLEDGIGVGTINDGRLIRGITSSAGEIGFNEFVLNTPSKKSILIPRKPKYLGDILSFTNIKQTINRGIEEGWESHLKKDADVDAFIKAIETGDPLAQYIMRLLGKPIATVCMNLLYSFNPQVLLLSGPLFYRTPQLISEINMHLQKATLQIPIIAAELKTSSMGEDSVTVGCAALVLDHQFNASVIT